MSPYLLLVFLDAAVLASAQTATPSVPLPPVEQVVKAYIDAVGGQSALDAVKSWELTGHLANARKLDPDKTKVTLYWKTPDKSHLILKTLMSSEDQGYDGLRPWVLMQHGHNHKLSNDKLENLQTFANPLRFTRLLKLYSGAVVEKRATVEGRPVTVVLANVSWGERRFSFDDQSHYLIQIEDHFKSGDPPRLTRLSDYKAVENLKLPHLIEQDWMDQVPGGGIRIEKVKLNVSIRDVDFEAPR